MSYLSSIILKRERRDTMKSINSLYMQLCI
ncbi:unnamed protein product [Strongylus vulgaris]|uniref:Uncharacterized protein n=1 Tax=Strongylus vulgaris TaxID=40348 RepID=A0A3P7I7D5_STRVU|nr:unnamed protein product [Strongylus vulgaris]